MTLADILSRAPAEPAARPKKVKKARKKKHLHVQEQKYHLIWRWRRRK